MSRSLIAIAVGGSGGHLYPAIALAEDLLKSNPELSIIFLGHGLSKNRYFDQKMFSYVDITSSTLSLTKFLKAPLACLRLLQGIVQSLKEFKKMRPSLVVGFGSFHSFPVLTAASFKGIPYILFESNAILGKVNQFFSKKARFVAHQLFDLKSPSGKSTFIKTTMPTSEGKLKKIPQEQARDYFNLDQGVLTLLVFGGSQGARSLNTLFLEALTFLEPKKIQVIHLVGFHMNLEEVKKAYETLKIKASVKAYESQMCYAYSAADMLLSRAGANTITEQLYYQLPAIFIPYPYLTDRHQTWNAAYVCDELQGGVYLEQQGLSGEKLAHNIKVFMEQKRYLKIKEALQKKKSTDKTDHLSELILKMLRDH